MIKIAVMDFNGIRILESYQNKAKALKEFKTYNVGLLNCSVGDDADLKLLQVCPESDNWDHRGNNEYYKEIATRFII